jgi:hypothetical protein
MRRLTVPNADPLSYTDGQLVHSLARSAVASARPDALVLKNPNFALVEALGRDLLRALREGRA